MVVEQIKNRERLPLTRRITRPGWRDPRLGVGLLLLAGSVGVGAWTVEAASATTPIYAARAPLTAGQSVSTPDFVVVEANAGAPEGTYVTPATDVTGVMLRSVGRGELLPAGAVAPHSTLDQRPIVIDVAGTLPSSVAAGSVVELWHAPAVSAVAGADAPQEPSRVVERVDVARVASDSSMLGGAVSTSVELLASSGDIPKILAARAAGGQLVVVPIQSAKKPQTEDDAAHAPGDVLQDSLEDGPDTQGQE